MVLPNLSNQQVDNNHSQKPILNVKVISPKQKFYEGPALSVSSANTFGKFDILPEHANFLTIVQNNPIVIRKISQVDTSKKEEIAFTFPYAIIYASKNNVRVYTDIQIEVPTV